MKFRKLNEADLVRYAEDALECYKTNHLILDIQSPLSFETEEDIIWFLKPYIISKDSQLIGIFDNDENTLYGVVIFDNIRIGENGKSCAQVHIATHKYVFGKVIRQLYRDMINAFLFTNIYAEIPSIAVHAIKVCKDLGFKKTGYIPEALPYLNSKGECKMYDIQIWSLRRE